MRKQKSNSKKSAQEEIPLSRYTSDRLDDNWNSYWFGATAITAMCVFLWILFLSIGMASNLPSLVGIFSIICFSIILIVWLGSWFGRQAFKSNISANECCNREDFRPGRFALRRYPNSKSWQYQNARNSHRGSSAI